MRRRCGTPAPATRSPASSGRDPRYRVQCATHGGGERGGGGAGVTGPGSDQDHVPLAEYGPKVSGPRCHLLTGADVVQEKLVSRCGLTRNMSRGGGWGCFQRVTGFGA